VIPLILVAFATAQVNKQERQLKASLDTTRRSVWIVGITDRVQDYKRIKTFAVLGEYNAETMTTIGM
jgi:hypothetical protein